MSDTPKHQAETNISGNAQGRGKIDLLKSLCTPPHLWGRG